MQIEIHLSDRVCPIHLSRGLLSRAGELLDLDRRVFVVTDKGVPARYAETLAAQCRQHTVFTVPPGEGSKSVETWKTLLEAMLRSGLTRGDCVVAVGGGVVGDLAGFAAASYMRGIDFYNVPTPVPGMADASVGGKPALNLAGLKNAVGAFWQPRAVLIDPDVLHTLPQRQIANGMAEILKMALCLDADLFARLEADPAPAPTETLLARAVALKKAVVEADERESGLRRVLNFGHTLGHGIEAVRQGRLTAPSGAEAAKRADLALLHGECVALGMLPMCASEVRARLIPVLERLELPTYANLDANAAMTAIAHDKKTDREGISGITVPAPGQWQSQTMTLEELRGRLETLRRTNLPA